MWFDPILPVIVAIVRSGKLDVDKIACCRRTENVNDLHHSVVGRNKYSEKVQITSHEHSEKQELKHNSLFWQQLLL